MTSLGQLLTVTNGWYVDTIIEVDPKPPLDEIQNL